MPASPQALVLFELELGLLATSARGILDCCSAFSSFFSCSSADLVAFFKASRRFSMSLWVVAGWSACCRADHWMACLCSLLLPVVVPDPAGLFLLFSILFLGKGPNKKQLFQAHRIHGSFFKDIWRQKQVKAKSCLLVCVCVYMCMRCLETINML